MLLTFAHDGKSVFSGHWTTSLTSVKSFDKLLLAPPPHATHWGQYSSGGTAALNLNDLLTGGSSGGHARLEGQVVENGTAGSSDDGIVFASNPDKAFTAGETVTATSTGTIVLAQDWIALVQLGPAKGALISIETGAIKFTLSGQKPTVTSGTNVGIQMDPGQSFMIRGTQNVKNFQAINAVASNGAILKYELFF